MSIQSCQQSVRAKLFYFDEFFQSINFFPNFQMDGRLKLTDEKVVFKSATKSGKAETIERNEIELVNWQRLAGTWGIRIFTKNGILHRFAGFKDSERDKLARFFKHSYDMDMLDKELSVKGHNWGNTNFEGGLMTFEKGTVQLLFSLFLKTDLKG